MVENLNRKNDNKKPQAARRRIVTPGYSGAPTDKLSPLVILPKPTWIGISKSF